MELETISLLEAMVILLIISLPLIALIDILRSKFEANNKLIWTLLVIFLNLLGVILYFSIGRKQKQ